MAINKIPQVTCSLNLGLIYNISYNYVPQEGIKISILFTNENGIFNIDSSILSTNNKTNITIGNASFNLYPVKYELLKSVGQKMLKVDFVDETFKLEKYYIVLTGRGCGQNVFELGVPVITSINQITDFPDIEYFFNDFLNALRSVFPVDIIADFDDSLPKTFTGTFKSVLSEWCSYYNLAYFFENSVLKIVDRAKLIINFPTNDQIPEALEFNVSETLENTYDTTAFAYIQRPGKKIGTNLIKYVTLFPIDTNPNIANTMIDIENDISNTLSNIFSDIQDNTSTTNTQTQYSINNINMLQVAAAMYGKEYWFLYNYNNGSSQECGWTNVDIAIAAGDPTWAQIMGAPGLQSLGAKFAQLDEKVFDAKFQFYKTFGERIAGRYYISDASTDNDDGAYQWYNNEDQNTSFINQQKVDVNIVSQGQTDSNPAFIPGTHINEYFQGISYVGNHIVFEDKINKNFSSVFSLPPNISQLIKGYFQSLVDGFEGSKNMDFTNIGGVKYILYRDQTLDPSLKGNFKDLGGTLSIFYPRYPTYSIKGMEKIQLQAIQNPGVNLTLPPNVSALQPNVLYSLYVALLRTQVCNSQSSGDGLDTYKRNFTNFTVSNDIEAPFVQKQIDEATFQNQVNLNLVLKYITSDILKALAAQNKIPLKNVTFTLNYFYDVPISFISNGLTSAKMEATANGINASYTYSNSMVQKIHSQAFIEELERSIRNSWMGVRHTLDNEI